MADVESLELKIKANSKKAQDSIDALIKTLDRLKKATAGACGLDKVTDQMGKLSASMSKIKKLNFGLSAANTKSAKSFSLFSAKALLGAVSLHKVTDVVGSWVAKSNDYVENLNLFTVAMGEYAASAQEYAEKVGEVMGIDPSAWMRNQGVFMTLATGFGVASDRAATMSQQLTQLGYDISSFFNIGVEDAMQKLQSGISGELEPLRRLGYDLSQAKLEATALSLGIDKTVSSMTQAEKAELRYYAIMQQVTTAHGDMARTINAPANQLRILKAQLEQAARALGNVFIPMLNALLPYAIAAVKVIRDLANELAMLMGFTLPEVDYSGVSAGASGATDALDEATSSANKLKKTLLGMDELNVMNDASAGAGVSAGYGSGAFDFELPTYDFMGEISKNVDKAYKTMKKILSPLKKIINAIVEYKELILLGLGITALVKVWEKLKQVWSWFSGLKLVSTFLNGFTAIKAAGGNVFTALGGGLAAVRSSLTGLQKAAIVAVAGFAEFAVVKNNVYELAMGCENAGAKIAEMGVVAGVAAVAMYAALGPTGLAIAAVVGLVGAMAGVTKAQEEMMTTMSNEVFYSGTGAKIGDIADAYSRLMDSIVSTHQPIIDNQANIDSLRDSVQNTAKSIDAIGEALAVGTVTASEKIEEIKSLFGQLKTDTKSIMDGIYDNIVAAIGGSFGDALLKAGQSIPEVLEILEQIRGEGVNTLGSLQAELDNLTADLDAGKITQEEFGTRWSEIEEKMHSLIGTTDEYNGVFDDLITSIDNINWEDETSKNNFFTQVTDKSKEAKDAINQASDAIINDLEAMKNWTTDDNLKAKIDEWITIAASDRERQLKTVDNQLTYLYDYVQKDMLLKAEAVKSNATRMWNEMGWFEQCWVGEKDMYVRRALVNYQNNVISPISNEIDDSLKKLGTDASAWANDAMSYVLDSMFEWDDKGRLVAFKGVASLSIAINDALGKYMPENQEAAEAAAGLLLDAIGKALNNSEKFNSWKTSICEFLSGALSEEIAEKYGTEFGEELGDNIAYALKKVKLPTIKGTVSATASGTTTMTFTAYAGGGFPETGQAFICREAGPELVGSIGSRTAVVNNDQIVESVSSGVYKAVVSAMGQSGGTQVVEAKVNDKVLFEVVVDRNRRETMRTGASPLFGGV